MIDYDKTTRGDILKVVGVGLPGICELGDLVRVTERTQQGVVVETKTGKEVECVFNCGAARLEPTEWKNDFPEDAPKETEEVQKQQGNK